jgi:SAM-dependent methyltransferase
MPSNLGTPGDQHADVTTWMRADWERRAASNAEYYINDRENEGFEFALSGCRDACIVLESLRHRLRHDMRMLEIGCGIGRMLPFFAAMFDEVHGVDISPSMIERGRTRLARHANIQLHVGDGRSLAGLPDDWFDLVVSFQVFQHIPSREVIASYVHDTFRVLRKGGLTKFLVKTGPWEGQQEHDTWCGVELSREDLEGWKRADPWREEACYDFNSSQAWVLLQKP